LNWGRIVCEIYIYVCCIICSGINYFYKKAVVPLVFLFLQRVRICRHWSSFEIVYIPQHLNIFTLHSTDFCYFYLEWPYWANDWVCMWYFFLLMNLLSVTLCKYFYNYFFFWWNYPSFYESVCFCCTRLLWSIIVTLQKAYISSKVRLLEIIHLK